MAAMSRRIANEMETVIRVRSVAIVAPTPAEETIVATEAEEAATGTEVEIVETATTPVEAERGAEWTLVTEVAASAPLPRPSATPGRETERSVAVAAVAARSKVAAISGAAAVPRPARMRPVETTSVAELLHLR